MTRSHAVGAIALFTVLMCQPILAQDASSASSAASSAASSEPSSATSGEASSELSDQQAKDNYGSLISALESPGSLVDLSTITEATSVDFVTVSSLKANGNFSALDNALDKNKLAIDQLRTDVAANALLSMMITTSGFATDDVIAIAVAKEGTASITVYIDDRA